MSYELVHAPADGIDAEALDLRDSSASELTMTVGRALGAVVVTVAGTLDDLGARMLRSVVGDLINNQGNMDVVIDLDGVTGVDIRSLDIFVAARGWASMRGGNLRLAGASGPVAQALEESGVARLVQVTGDRIHAVPTPAAEVARAAHPAGRARS